MYRVQARKDGEERAVPEHAETWLRGFDGLPIGSEPKPVSDTLEGELDEVAVSKEDQR